MRIRIRHFGFPLAPVALIAGLALMAGCESQPQSKPSPQKNITVEFCVNADGSVSQPRVVARRPPGKALDQAALETILKWKFYPARSSAGVPVRRCGVRQVLVFELLGHDALPGTPTAPAHPATIPIPTPATA